MRLFIYNLGMWPGNEDSRPKWGMSIFRWCYRCMVFAGMSVLFIGQLCDIYSIIDDVVAVSEKLFFILLHVLLLPILKQRSIYLNYNFIYNAC